jgi:hypothetical protein
MNLKPGINHPRKGSEDPMGDWRTRAGHWLSSEEHDAGDAEEAFAQVFAALPAVDPSADFVQRATDAAWLARVRRRRVIAAGGLVASISIAAPAAYGVFGVAGAWMLATVVSAVTGSVVTLLGAATTGLQWWYATAQAGMTMADVVAMPGSAAALFVMELVAVAALYMLHRVLRADLRWRDPGALCV